MRICDAAFRTLEDVAAWMIGTHNWSAEQLDLESPSFPWAELLVASRMHNMAPALCVYLAETDRWNLAPEPVREILCELRRVSDEKARIFTEAAAEVVALIERESIPVAVRKGLVTRQTLYGAPSVRGYEDIDLLVSPTDARAVEGLLNSAGFVPGRINRRNDQIVPLPRDEVVRTVLSPDHLLKYVRASGSPAVPGIPIDVALSFTWARSEFALDVPLALRSVEHVTLSRHLRLPQLSSEYMFIDCAMHIFREAFLESGIVRGDDVTFIKFVEVALFVKSLGSDTVRLQRAVSLVRDNGLGRAIAWILAHTDSLFGSNSVRLFGLDQFVEPAFLNQYRRSGGRAAQWQGAMRERLQDRSMLQNAITRADALPA